MLDVTAPFGLVVAIVALQLAVLGVVVAMLIEGRNVAEKREERSDFLAAAEVMITGPDRESISEFF